MLKNLFTVACLLLVATCTPNASAGLTLDNFSLTDVGSVQVYSNGALTLNRVITGGSVVQGFGVVSSTNFQISYAVSGGSFGQLTPSQRGGLSFNLGLLGPTDFNYTVTANSGLISFGDHTGVAIVASGPPIEILTNLNDITSFEISISKPAFTAENGFAIFGGAQGFSAVPEPSSLLLAGLGVTGLAGVRRRRK